jgi:N-acetyl-gamma-glutamyl-phosphate reductase
MITVGIVGGAGYTAGELLRILLGHPLAEVKFVHSTSNAGQPVCSVHRDLLGETTLRFASEIDEVDVIFLCLGHGLSAEFLQKNRIAPRTKIIDLGNDFRVSPTACGEREFAYGLPEAFRSTIAKANNVANPGCFATAIQLALLPLARHQLLQDEAHVHAITGSTGAGRSLSDSGHFSYRSGNVSIYKPFAHQHLAEICKTLQTVQGRGVAVNFIPVRGCFTRGIFATVYTSCPLSEDEATALYDDYYRHEPFVFTTRGEVSLKDVLNTNKCLLRVQKIGDKLLITSVLDNLVKGASGQAVQNMNNMFEIEEIVGLKLKSIAF